MLLTYEDYLAFERHDIIVCQDEFAEREFRAEKTVQKYTQGRAGRMERPSEAVKRLMVELIRLDASTASARSGAPLLRSFQTDGYSESYELASREDIAFLEEELVDQYLTDETDDNGTPLLYRGTDV